MTRPIKDRGMMNSVHARRPNDIYATIDKRCVAHLNKVWPLRGRTFVEPMAGYGDLIKQVESHGGRCEYASDLIDHPGADASIVEGRDIFAIPRNEFLGKTVISNPPFAIQRPVIRYLLEQAALEWLVLLLRASQMHVADGQDLMTGGQLHAVVPLPFRPIWVPVSVQANIGPRHEYAWFIWQPRWGSERPPQLLFA
jgi:hypothetical protein